jgi:hypothetical protein
VVGPTIAAVAVTLALGLGERAAVATWPRAARLVAVLAPDVEFYASFTATVAQVTSVFLGLYFTAVSLVASTSYRDVPSEVRSIVLEEKVGGIYLKLLAYIAATSLILLAGITIGAPIGVANFGLLATSSVASVFAFLRLGLRTFAFFDPAALALQLHYQILSAARSATSRGFRYGDPSFQAAYRGDAERALRSYQGMADLCSSSDARSGASLKLIAIRAVAIQRAYTEEKHRIPTDSLWFRRTLRHKSWLTADSSRLEMAIQTETALQADEVADPLWLESELTVIIATVVRSLMKRRDYRAVAEVAVEIQALIEALSSRFAQDEAVARNRATWALLASLPADDTSTKENAVFRLERMAAADALSMGGLSLILGAGKGASALQPELVRTLSATALQEEQDSPIGHPVPANVRRAIQFLRGAHAFEVAAEGRSSTSAWYLDHILARHLSTSLSKIVTTLLTELRAIPREVVSRAQRGDDLLAVFGIQRGLEACNKLEWHTDEIEAAARRLESLRWAHDSEPWPKVDGSAVDAALADVRAQLLRSLAEVAPRLPTDAPTGDEPDVFGYAYTSLAKHCYEALLNGRPALFQQIFPTYFKLAFAAHSRILAELADEALQTRTTLSADILLDVLELSGYALVYGDMGIGGVWECAKGEWDQYLGSHPDPRKVIQFLGANAEYRRTAISMSSRDLVRTSWVQGFERSLRERNLMSDEFDSVYERSTRPLPAEWGTVARTFIRRSMFRHAADVFMARYLFERPDATDLKRPRGVEEFNESFTRYEKRQKGSERQEDELGEE